MNPLPTTTRSAQFSKNSHNKKVLLVTIYGNDNYGNIFQRCALSRMIESLGFDVWHLCEIRGEIHEPVHQPFIIRAAKYIIKRILAFFGVKKYRRLFKSKALSRRIEPLFSKFQDKYIIQRIYMTHKQALTAEPSCWNEYDYAVVGSDQVWHGWSHKPEELEYYYLSFMPKQKRVCYAPSFGFPTFHEDDYPLHQKGLNGFERLSCREQEMIPLIKAASGKNAQAVLDPTMLLTRSQWRDYAQKPGYDVPDDYVLCYFLGSKTPEYRAAVSRAAGGLPVINLLDMDDKLHLAADPAGFIWLMDHADFVCTDSFHGTVFSILFGRNFLAFRRRQKGMEDMFGRIDGLLANMNIKGHVYEEGMTARPDAVNYDDVYSRLEALRKISMDYLRGCLK